MRELSVVDLVKSTINLSLLDTGLSIAIT